MEQVEVNDEINEIDERELNDELRTEFDFEENEQFKLINGYENHCVSNCGRVYNIKTSRFVGGPDRDGYIQVGFRKDGKMQNFKVHRLVLQYFGEPQPEGKGDIDHIDHDRSNNHIENLRWVSKSENHKNRGSYRGVESEYFEEIPAAVEDMFEVNHYGNHEFEDLHYADGYFYFDTGVNFRRLDIKFKRNGAAYVNVRDTKGKQTHIHYTKFKKLLEEGLIE